MKYTFEIVGGILTVYDGETVVCYQPIDVRDGTKFTTDEQAVSFITTYLPTEAI